MDVTKYHGSKKGGKNKDQMSLLQRIVGNFGTTAERCHGMDTVKEAETQFWINDVAIVRYSESHLFRPQTHIITVILEGCM